MDDQKSEPEMQHMVDRKVNDRKQTKVSHKIKSVNSDDWV